MYAEGCGEGKLQRFEAELHLEAVRLATSTGGPSMLSLVHKLGHLELWSMIAHFVAVQY